MTRILSALPSLLLAGSCLAQATWQEALAKMPLTPPVTQLNRTNCARIMLQSFQRNPTVKALIFMPGATYEIYYDRVHATNAGPTLLDAVAALTNQTYIHADFCPPFLLLHGIDDLLDVPVAVQDEKTLKRIQSKKFDRHAVFNDADWDHVEPWLAFAANTVTKPPTNSMDSWHFFRTTFAEFDLTAWEAMEASALSGRTKITVQRKHILFEGDDRKRPDPVPPPHKALEWKKP